MHVKQAKMKTPKRPNSFFFILRSIFTGPKFVVKKSLMYVVDVLTLIDAVCPD